MGEFIQTTFEAVSEALIPCMLIILLLMPFWYIALYLLHRNFFERSTQFLKLCFCFCLSFCWFVTFAFFTMMLPENKLKAPEPSTDSILPLLGSTTHVFYFLTATFSILCLCIAIVRYYNFIRSNKGKDFYVLLKSLYIGLILGLAGVLVLYRIVNYFRG